MALKSFLARNRLLKNGPVVFQQPVKSIFHLLAALALLGLIACGAGGIQPSPGTQRRPVPEPTRPEKGAQTRPEDESQRAEPPAPSQPAQSRPDPSRRRAALELAEQAQSLISAGRADRAIRTLERAISLNPSSWQNYYYLAEAWLQKKNTDQALHFNELASIHLSENTPEQKRIANQRQRIRELADKTP